MCPMSNKILQKYCEYALSVLNAQFQATQVVQHNGTLGSIREQLIKDFLRAHLPELVTIMSGQVIDSSDKYSRQQDIVLVLKSTPRLPFASGNDLIFVEGVVAAVEVKTNLDTNALVSIGQNFASVRSLVPQFGSFAQMGRNHNWPVDKVLTIIITYTGMTLESVAGTLGKLGEESSPDIVLDLSKGLLIKNHGLLVDRQGDFGYLRYDSAAQGFMILLTILAEITGTLSARGSTWRAYC